MTEPGAWDDDQTQSDGADKTHGQSHGFPFERELHLIS
jgi:hypothetical protein